VSKTDLNSEGISVFCEVKEDPFSPQSWVHRAQAELRGKEREKEEQGQKEKKKNKSEKKKKKKTERR
jgi:hypothetical protein